MPAPLPCQGTGIIRLPGPPQVGSSSRPLSRLQVTVKMRSIRAILITGSCISQKHVCSKEQQAKRRKKIFSPCRRLSFPPPCRQPPITGSQVSKSTSGEFSLFQRVLIWHQILYFPCKYLKQKHFQAPSSSLESYWSCFSGHAEDFWALYHTWRERSDKAETSGQCGSLWVPSQRAFSSWSMKMTSWHHSYKRNNLSTVFQWFSSVERKPLECCCCMVRKPSDSSWFFSSLWSFCYPSLLRTCCISGMELCVQNWKLN